MKRNSQFIALLLLIFLTVGPLLILFPALNIPQFLDSVKSTDPVIFLFACMMMLVSNAFGALRWSVFATEINAPVSAQFSHAFGIYSLGQIAGLVVPSRIGNYAKVPLVKKLDTISYEDGISAVNAETIIDLMYIGLAGIVSLGILSVVLHSSFQFASLLLLLFLMASLFGILVLLSNLDHFNERYERFRITAGRSDQPFWKKVPARCMMKIYELSLSTRKIFTNKNCVVKSGFYTLVFQLIGMLSFFFVIEAAHETLPLTIVFAILTLSILAGIISLIPGGFGASDISQIVLLVSQGISLPVATNIVILWRVVMYFPIVLVIGIYFIKTRLWFENT